MKKKSILNLVRYYAEKNDIAFRDEAYLIAKDFEAEGDYQLSDYIVSVLSSSDTFFAQGQERESTFLRQVQIKNEPLPLPDVIKEDIDGVINAILHRVGINKFLFEGAPGTGKTESVKQIARILERNLYIVNFDEIIDSHLGQTQKNIATLFEDINGLLYPNKSIILFDEIDSLAIDRINSNDLREMGRATSAMLKGLDVLHDDVVIIATTNLYASFDKALIRRFNTVINFNRYTREELIDIAAIMTNKYLDKFKMTGKNTKLLKKIIGLMENIPYPADLINTIKTAIAFSRVDSEYDYLRRLFNSAYTGNKNLKELQKLGFTVREIEILTGISKSQVSREVKGEHDE